MKVLRETYSALIYLTRLIVSLVKLYSISWQSSSE